ncbi:RtcB family protein [Rubricoccus marinus]|uniref:tRNA-splicing ligase RtcB n=1 Tax=Rubricoccus marinus TaxID=716817 RepID=A0A259TX36_9BACT|nr:RtcB family protein [Rubricoccus marinus]OZC02134.1 RNA-splicing ligase RtcB [Rubricoccus marinus]
MSTIIPTGDATAILPARDTSLTPITVIGNEAIRETFDEGCIRQALNAREAPGVSGVVLNPDAHLGYGAPVGCAMSSPTHIYPGPVGVDIKCSMSLLQLDLPADAVDDKRTRRALIEAIEARTPTGAGRNQRSVPKGRAIPHDVAWKAVTEGASGDVLTAMGVPTHWAERCEDSFHVGHDGTADALRQRLTELTETGQFRNVPNKLSQLGTYGGGNHFGECEVVETQDAPTAERFGLIDGGVAYLTHCGSRGFGFNLAQMGFEMLEKHFEKWNLEYPAGDKQLAYAPLGTPEADAYLDMMALGANFATVNHMLINALILEAFQEVIPGTSGDLVYFISHNIAREEITPTGRQWVHRKGATRAFPAGHPGLEGTPFADIGHPILLPGNPQAGSAVMVAEPGAEKSQYSVNHGAGRRMGRRHAKRTLDQRTVDASFNDADILTNCRQYPIDEAPAAYKDFDEVLASVETAGLARSVARLKARFVIKDADKQYGGAA